MGSDQEKHSKQGQGIWTQVIAFSIDQLLDNWSSFSSRYRQTVAHKNGDSPYNGVSHKRASPIYFQSPSHVISQKMTSLEQLICQRDVLQGGKFSFLTGETYFTQECLRGDSFQFSSFTQSCPTLCDPKNRSMPGLPVHHQLPQSRGLIILLVFGDKQTTLMLSVLTSQGSE